MTDQELIQALRCCGKVDDLSDCPNCPREEVSCGYIQCVMELVSEVADRLEALLAENEHLREVTKMMPQWKPGSEPPKEYRNEYGEPKCFLVCLEETEEPFRAFYDGKNWGDGWNVLDVTHWMPLPQPPSTEGVE